jgi:hypothetical protein
VFACHCFFPPQLFQTHIQQIAYNRSCGWSGVAFVGVKEGWV